MKIPRNVLAFLAAICLTLVGATLFTSRAEASPAAPVEFTLTQPDGSSFTARQWGDEWNNGFETLDGFSILRTPDGWWAYAGIQSSGLLGVTLRDDRPLVVGRDDPEGLTPHLRPTAARENPHSPAGMALEAPALESPQAPGLTGLKTLVLLAKFTNQSETYSAASFQTLMFSTTSSSVRNYYREVSFNNLDIVPAEESCGTSNDGVTDWTNLGYDHPNPGIYLDSRNQQIVKDVLAANDACINFARFDTNGNGFIDSNELAIVVVVAGYERAYGPQYPSVWAHSWALDEVTPPVLDGKVIGNSAHGGYAQVGEQHEDHQATIGVMAHEYGHFINWPDLYDIDGSSFGVGRWSLMGTGGWNQTTRKGDSPAHPDAFLKWYQGWITPTPIFTTQNNVAIVQAENNPVAYLLRLNPGGVDWEFNNKSGRGEYFLVENRQLTMYDSGLPGCGLLIWHIDESVTFTNQANASEIHPLVFLEQADGANHLGHATNDGDASDPWPGAGGHYGFQDNSVPNSKLYSGDDSFVSVRVTVGCSANMVAQYLSYTPDAPGDFVKLNPANTAVEQPTHLVLDWEDASEAASYAYCIDDTPNGTCSGTWLPTGVLSLATLDGLQIGTTYEWQARATNTGGTTEANTGGVFTFTTGSIAYDHQQFLPAAMVPPDPPAAFSKSYPVNAAAGITIHPTIDWEDATGANSYDFCYDLTVNGDCTGGWNSTGLSSQITLANLQYGATYEWQARAVNYGGTTYADGGVTWNFTTQPASASWSIITSEDFETPIPKTNWSRHDNGVSDGGEYFIGRRNCNVRTGGYSGWLIGGGAQGEPLLCGANYSHDQDSWFIYGPFNTINATAGQLNYDFYVNSEDKVDWLTVMATDDYSGVWVGWALSGIIPWSNDSFNLNGLWCGAATYSCMGRPEVYIAFAFDSDSTNQISYGAIIDNIVLRLCYAGSCSGGAPPYEGLPPLSGDAILDFLQPFLQGFGEIRYRTLPE